MLLDEILQLFGNDLYDPLLARRLWRLADDQGVEAGDRPQRRQQGEQAVEGDTSGDERHALGRPTTREVTDQGANAIGYRGAHRPAVYRAAPVAVKGRPR